MQFNKKDNENYVLIRFFIFIVWWLIRIISVGWLFVRVITVVRIVSIGWFFVRVIAIIRFVSSVGRLTIVGVITIVRIVSSVGWGLVRAITTSSVSLLQIMTNSIDDVRSMWSIRSSSLGRF